jgi:multiple antibiotic resistance protein
LALPLIAGPATLTTLLMLSRIYGYAAVVAVLAVNFAILFGALWAARTLSRILGTAALTAISKLVMLLLAAIAVNFIRVGITQIVLDVSGRR